MQNILDTLATFWEDFYQNLGLSIVRSIAFLILGLIVVKIVQITVKKATIRSRKLDNAAATFITSVITIVVYIALAIVVISSLGFSTASIIAAFSAVALAIALGLQDTLASITNGIIIIFTHPFKQGDYIEVGASAGTVKEIRLFNTKLVTPDNITLIIPNSNILTSDLKNYSAMPLRRIDISVPISYSCDVAQVKNVLMECVRENENVVNIPEPFCAITEYGDRAVMFVVRVWVKNSKFWDVKFNLLERIFVKLKERGITIPVNRLDVRVIDQNDINVRLVDDNSDENHNSEVYK